MRDWLEFLLAENRVVELRHPDGDRWRSGLFDDLGALRLAMQRQQRQNLFTSLNRPHDDIKATNAMGSAALTDADMRMHTRLPFDFDPVRPKGCPSTDAELAEGIKARHSLMSALTGLGWPAPAVAISGNGGHLIYRLRLPVADHVREMLATIYRGLRQDFSTEAVEFDPTVRNPARIWRAYGTQNRKGIATHDRPHRTAQIVIPARWEVVPPRMVEALANAYARTLRPQAAIAPRAGGQVNGSGDYSTLDAPAWFLAHDAYRRHLGRDKHAVRCPWAHEHSSESGPFDTSTVIWEAGPNWPRFHCSHSHCEGRNIRDVLELWGDADAHCARAWKAAT